MPIPEAQLETWCSQGQTGQFTATYDTLKTVLNSGHAPYANQDKSIFLQGSYKNDTNVHADSDVDVVIRLDSIFYTDLSFLTESDKSTYNAQKSAATYTLADFKKEITNWLTQTYGSSVKPGTKAIFIQGSGARRDADVLPCAEFRRYYKFSATEQSYVEGICFFNSSGTRIENFPKQHSDNCTTKHQVTNSWFKRTVRVYKNARNKLIKDGKIQDGLAPSYFIEGMLYNVPADRFGGTHVQNFTDTLNWIYAADRSKFLCANEQFYLLNDASPVTWRAANCDSFLNALVALWKNW
jgi:hypothetical protein